jgi:amino-acid N-acetyltransferase
VNSPRSLHPATGEDTAFVESLLAANDLPTAGLANGDATLWVATEGNARVGCGGLELYESAGLLRSVAVEEPHRGRGVASELCDALEAEARDAGVAVLYLLTTTAAEFFAARGYERCDRDDAPDTIRETTEFASLCPDTAVCMRKPL